MSQPAMRALEAWRDTCDPAVQAAVDELLRLADSAANTELVAQVNARAAMHGHRAVTTAWTDVADDARINGAIFSEVGSCDTHLISKPAGAFLEMEPTLGSAKMAATIPLSDITLYDGQTLDSYLKAQGSTGLPEVATVKTKACLVYSDSAEVMLRVHPYFGVRMTTYAMVPGSDWMAVGIRQGGGLVGMGAADGEMKAFAFSPAPCDGGGAANKNNAALPFGPKGAELTTARDDVIMTVTLFRKGREEVARDYFPPPIYRSLGAAQVTASSTNIGAAVDKPDLAGEDVIGVVVELFFCKVVSDRAASAADVDAMCRQTLASQVAIGGTRTPAVVSALVGLMEQ